MRLVVDASIAVEFLLQTDTGRHAANVLYSASLLAPELVDAEVLAVLRREVLGGRLPASRAREALEDLAAWDIRRVPHRELLETAWSLRHDVTAYDALYLAVARQHRAGILTADGPLSRVPLAGVTIQNLRSG